MAGRRFGGYGADLFFSSPLSSPSLSPEPQPQHDTPAQTFGWCCCLNFLVAAGSVLVLQWVQWALHLCYALLGGGEQMLEDKLTQVLLMGLTHTILWKVPLYLVSYPLNYVWLCEIFDEAYRELYACNKKEGAASYSAVLDKMTDSLMQALLLALVMVQTEAIRYAAGIPLFVVGLFFGRGDEAWAVGRALTMPVALCYEAWAYSFYAFGSRLDQQPNVTLQKKIVYFQARWMYFLGFGLPPVALLAYVASYDAFLSTVLYFVVLPVHAVLSVPAHPEKQQAYDPLPIFKHAGFLLSAVLPLLHAQFRL